MPTRLLLTHIIDEQMNQPVADCIVLQLELCIVVAEHESVYKWICIKHRGLVTIDLESMQWMLAFHFGFEMKLTNKLIEDIENEECLYLILDGITNSDLLSDCGKL